MKNKLAMFTGVYVLATITAGIYAYQRFSQNKTKCAVLKDRLDNEINMNNQLNKNIAELEKELKNKSSKRSNALRDLLIVNQENWDHLSVGYKEQRDRADKSDKLVKELKQVISIQNIRKMELFVELSKKDSEILKLKTENCRLLENNENLALDLGDAQLALQSADVELKSLRARLADYECPDELAIKL